MNINVNNNVTSISLKQLVAWEGNVRKTDADAGIDELAASIAAHGLLQSLVVTPAGKSGKRAKYAVIAGRRRYLALKALAKSGAIEADMPVPCSVASGDIDPTELSLAENIVRAPMHPADQFEAFRDLIDNGSSVAEVAARFSIAESVVAKRLKLGRLSPAVLAAYRAEEIGLEQAEAFAISDDHAAQERVLESGGHLSPSAIRRALTEGEIPATDRRVRFVGLVAYAEAGGLVRRDLFDQEGGGYVLDEALLDRLVSAKLAAIAAQVTAEGWRWVETVPEIDYSMLSDYRRLHAERAELSEDEQAELDRLSTEYDELAEAEDDANDDRLSEIEQRIEEINESAEHWQAETLAIAGALIALDRDGEIRVERGLVRKRDETDADRGAGDKPAAKNGTVIPATLVSDLTAQKTAALSAVLARSPDIALAAIVYTLAASLFGRKRDEASCVEIAPERLALRRAMAKPGACRALVSFEQECERWASQLPGTPAELWDWCLSQSRETLLSLLALCTALTVNAVRGKADRPASPRLCHGDALARALGLDMSEWFTPDADSYFGRINRAGIVAAIQEAKGMEPAPSWLKMKKAELAQIAARQVAGTGWLPEPMRLSDGIVADVASEEADEPDFEAGETDDEEYAEAAE